jgi:DNA-binding CsgD family transcriptional regulator/tetratricopeptide (TPR) repeat protein
MARRVSSPRLVGRTQELAQLAAALERARAGSPAAVLVAGEAGVGKTRLVGEFAARASAAGGTSVLTGGCVALVEGEPAYAPLVEALRGLVQRLGPAALPRLLAGDRGELARLLPELGEAGRRPTEQDLGGEAGRARLFAVVHRVLARLAADAPVVLVVEDLHWADRSSLEFLAYLIRNVRAERLLLVGTWRSDELPRGHPVRRWLAEQHRSPRVEPLELARLSRAELAEQLAGILGTPAPELVETIFDRSQGNPFFAEELLAADGTGAGLPARLREVLLLRVGDCTPAAQAVLRVAAVAGRRVEERLLAAVAPLGEAELLAGLREAVDQQLLVVSPDEDVYAFRHALVQEAVYGELLPGERTRLHAALAERLGSGEAGGPGSAAEVAVHWYRARNRPDALAWSARAAAEADAMRAYAEALGHYERVLELWDRVADTQARAGMDHVEVLRRAAQAAYDRYDDAGARALIGRALREVDPVAEPVRAGLLHERRSRYEVESKLEAAGEAVRLIPAAPPTVERARVLARLAEVLFSAGRSTEARAAAEEALAVARRLGADHELVRALIVVGGTQAASGTIETAVAALQEAARLAEQHADPDPMKNAHVLLGEVLMQAGRLEEAAEVSLAGRELLRRLGLPAYWESLLLANAAEALFKLGRWDEADRLATQAVAQASPEEPPVILALVMLEVQRGEFHAAKAHLKLRKHPPHFPEFTRACAELQAELRVWQGQLEDARTAVEDGLDQVAGTDEQARSGRLLWLGMRTAADQAEQARARRHPGGVDDAVRGADALAARAAATRPNPLVDNVTPVLASGVLKALLDGERSRLEGRSDPDRWQEVAAAWLGLGRPYPAAYARWRQAEALLMRGEPASRAAESLQAAHATALRLGAKPLLGEVAALARRARIPLEQPISPATPAAPTPAERLGLTERELEVLAYVTAGRSNREIGEALFISGKTASVHISNILRKLGVTSRVQAATAAQRLGLVDQPPAGP